MERRAAKECTSVTTSLVKYNAARLAIQQAHAVDEVRAIKDKAEALRQYALQVGDVEMQNWMVEIKLRAERRAGELLAEGFEHGTIAGQGPNSTNVSTISDFGISKNESSAWQRLAAVPEAVFEEAIVTAKAGNSELTQERAQ
jgi:hypothetical protein